MVTNHDDAVFDHHPTPTRGFTETVNWALKHATFSILKSMFQRFSLNISAFVSGYGGLRTFV